MRPEYFWGTFSLLRHPVDQKGILQLARFHVNDLIKVKPNLTLRRCYSLKYMHQHHVSHGRSLIT